MWCIVQGFFSFFRFFFGGYANLAVADEVVGMYVFIHSYIHSIGALGAGSLSLESGFFGDKEAATFHMEYV